MIRMVKLLDGSEVDSASEAHRMEAEARSILRMPLDDRRAWLNDLEHGWTSASGRFIPGRGTVAVDALRKTMAEIHAAGRAQ